MKRLAALGVVAVLTATGCSLGERTKQAERLVASPTKAEAAGTAVGTMTFTLSAQPVDGAQDGAPLGQGVALGGANITPPPAGELPIVIDFAKRAASISLTPQGGAPEPMVVLEGDRVYVRRGTTTGISSRRWVVLDLAALDEFNAPEPTEVGQRTGLPMVAFPGPLQLVELLAGSLTGSTKEAGPNTYAANLSREKADRELGIDGEEAERRYRSLATVAALDEIHPATITLDAEGRPEAFDIRLRPRLRRDLKVEVKVAMRLTYQPAEVVIPAADDALVLETEGQLIAELIALGEALAGSPAEEGSE